MEPAQWPQQGVERKVRPHKEKALNCPRCNSINTKFCYYNNYSLRQPRYFCKSCRRYWTDGGSLRNVPVGGGSRKNKRIFNSSSSSSLPSSTATTVASSASTASLVSSSSRNLQPFKLIPHELSSFSLSSSVSALEPIRSGISSRRLISFEAPNSSKEIERSTNATIELRTLAPSQSLYRQELHRVNMEELMWSSKVKVPLEYGVGSMEEREEGGKGNLAFPYEDLKQVSNKKVSDEIVEGVDPTLFWEGVIENSEVGGGW